MNTVKQLLLYLISIVTCVYFLSSGNITLFSKFKKSYEAELIDFDKDASDKSDETEKQDGKEGFGEENFIAENRLLLTTNTLLSFTVYISENDLLPQGPLLEINSPPPQA